MTAGNSPVACITGAGRGIGMEAALLLASEGTVVHVGDLDVDAASDVAARVNAEGGTAIPHECDVSSATSVERMFASIQDEHGRLDALVNNAGIYPKIDFFATTVDDFDRIMGVNVRGVFLCTMAAVPLLESAGGGSVVCMSSSAGTLQSLEYDMPSSLPLYGASKAAVDRWALNAAKELSSRNIAVNVLYPAGILTDGARALGLTDDYIASMSHPSVVAPAIAWLAGQTPQTMTGEIVLCSEFGVTWGPTEAARDQDSHGGASER